MPGMTRGTSRSSKRQTKVPDCERTESHAASAVRALPTWINPVGEGAYRPRGKVMARECKVILSRHPAYKKRTLLPGGLYHMRPKTLAVLVAALLIAVPIFSQEAGLTGHWEGNIEIPGQKLGVNLDFTQEGDAWKGDISIPLQNAKDIPLINIKLEGNAATFEIQGIPGTPTFKGTLEGSKIAGDFTQSGGSFPFSVERGVSGADSARKELEGY